MRLILSAIIVTLGLSVTNAVADETAWDANVTTVTTTATRTRQSVADSPVLTEVIGEREIELSGAENLADLLEDHPGVFLARSFRGTSLQMQGLPPEYTLVLLNGQRLAGKKDGAVDLSRITLQGVRQVEIVKGASSALYGSDAIGGVVNVISEDAALGWSGGTEISYGEDNASFLGANASYGGDRFEVSADLSYESRDAYDLDPSNASTSGGAFDDGTLKLMGRFRPDDVVTLRGGLRYGYRELAAIDANDVGATFDRLTNEETIGGDLGVDLAFSSNLLLQNSLNLSWFESRFLLDQRGSSALDNREVTTEGLGQLTSTLHWYAGRNVLTAGVEGLYESVEANRIDGGSTDRNRVAPFAQLEWNLDEAGRWTLLPGARLDADSQFGTHFSPKLAVRYAPVEAVTFRGSIGQGFRSPDFRELYLIFENPSAGYVVEGNPDLEPETSLSYNLSVDWVVTDWFDLTINGFHNDLENMIDYALRDTGVPGIGDRFVATNIGEVTTQGVETSFRFRSGRAFQAKFGYVYTDAVDRDLDRRLEGRAYHSGTVSLQYEARSIGLRGSVRGSYVGQRNYYPTAGVVFEENPYVALDLRIEKTATSWLTVFVGADNVTNAGNGDYLNIPPRSIYGGVRATFQSTKDDGR